MSNHTSPDPSAQEIPPRDNAGDQRRISLFANSRKTKPVGELTLEQALACIRDGTYQQAISSARQILSSQGLEAYTKAKNALPAVTFAGTFSYRNNKSLMTHSGQPSSQHP
jgi:hypothetical protein